MGGEYTTGQREEQREEQRKNKGTQKKDKRKIKERQKEAAGTSPLTVSVGHFIVSM